VSKKKRGLGESAPITPHVQGLLRGCPQCRQWGTVLVGLSQEKSRYPIGSVLPSEAFSARGVALSFDEPQGGDACAPNAQSRVSVDGSIRSSFVGSPSLDAPPPTLLLCCELSGARSTKFRVLFLFDYFFYEEPKKFSLRIGLVVLSNLVPNIASMPWWS
jgi:hypothetical protein